jgi:hypothetical protein
MSPLAWFFLGLALFLVVTLAYNSSIAVRIRVARWQARFEQNLRTLADHELKRRLRESDYFDLEAKAALKDSAPIRGFLQRLADENYEALYRDFFDETGRRVIPAYFVDAERDIAYVGRPMILDYDSEFASIIRVLRERAQKGRPQ